jgi:hypothetical protein
MEKSASIFKEILLESKVWGDPNFDEVPLILLVDDPDGGSSGVWAGIYEGPEEPDENELGEDGMADPFRIIYMQACFKLSECDPPKYEGGKKWIRQGSGENGEEGMSTCRFGFGNIEGVYTPKANVDLDAVMELWLQQIRETPPGQNVWHNIRT